MGHGIRDEADRDSSQPRVLRFVSYIYGGHRPGIRRAFLETAPPQLRHARHHFYFAPYVRDPRQTAALCRFTVTKVPHKRCCATLRLSRLRTTTFSPLLISRHFSKREKTLSALKREKRGKEKKKRGRRRGEEENSEARMMMARLVTEFHGRRVIFRVIG